MKLPTILPIHLSACAYSQHQDLSGYRYWCTLNNEERAVVIEKRKHFELSRDLAPFMEKHEHAMTLHTTCPEH